jgi:hypothetical protein
MSPLILNAFDLIILSQGLNLAALFDRGQVWIIKCAIFEQHDLSLPGTL